MQQASRFTWPVLWLLLAAFLVARATSRRESRGVILDHLEFGRRLLAATDVYAPWHSDPDAPPRPLHAPYPPSFGLLTAPFAVLDAHLGLRAARLAWALLQVGALLACALSMRNLLATRAPPQRWQMLWLLTFGLGLRFVLRDLHGGGGNTINLALCLLAFVAAERQRAGLAGLLLAFSLVTKPTQLWLLPLLWLFGRSRAVAWTLAWAAMLIFCTLALQHFDCGPWQRWATGSWLLGAQADAFAVPSLGFPEFEWMNQSLRAALARWLGTVPEAFAARVSLGMPGSLHAPLALVAWTNKLASLAMLLLLYWHARKLRHAPLARVWLVAAALIVSVLLSPLSWKAHHVALLPCLCLLLGQGRRNVPWLAAWGLCCLPGRDLVGDAVDEWANSMYFVTLWDLLLLQKTLQSARAAAREHEQFALRAS